MYKESGFTLLEIIIATIILSLTILGLLGVFIAGNNWVLHLRERATSAELGKLFVDPLQMDVRQDTWGSPNSLSTTPNPVSQTINAKPFTATYVTGNIAGTDVRRVITTVTWTEAATTP